MAGSLFDALAASNASEDGAALFDPPPVRVRRTVRRRFWRARCNAGAVLVAAW